MKLIEFTDFIKDIYKFYRYKNPPLSEEIETWLLEVDYIPGDALPWILDNLKHTKDSLPRNLPRALDQQWHLYRDANPEKFTRAQEVADYNCPECHGIGVLHFRYTDFKTKLKYTAIVICASCRSSHKKFGSILHEGGKVCNKNEIGSYIPSGEYVPPMLSLTKQEILDRGWEFLEAENPYAEKVEQN